MMNLSLEKEERAYRKNLKCDGLIYLGYEEHPIRVLNLSLTGILAEFRPTASIHNIKDIFQSLLVSPIVDIYLPDIRVAGEAEVVRVDSTEQGIIIALDFRNLSYDVDNLLYKRRAYRKNMTVPGQILIDGIEYPFYTENISVDGIMARIQGKFEVDIGMAVNLNFKQLELQGDCEIVWVEQDTESTLLGLRYLYLVRDSFLCHLPNFVQHKKEMPLGDCRE